jgi:hypothetical protein
MPCTTYTITVHVNDPPIATVSSKMDTELVRVRVRVRVEIIRPEMWAHGVLEFQQCLRYVLNPPCAAFASAGFIQCTKQAQSQQ